MTRAGLLASCLCAAFVARGPAHAEDLGRIEAAAAAHPNRPGLQLVLARARLRAGDLAGAEGIARRVLERWPRSTRARLILDRVARLRGETPTTPPHTAPEQARVSPIAQAFLDPPRRPGQWTRRGHVGGQFDSRVTPLFTVFSAPGALGSTRAFRLIVGAGVAWRDATWRWQLGLDRSVHLPSDDDVAVGAFDRTVLWSGLRGRRALLGGELTGGVYMRGAVWGRGVDGGSAAPGVHLGWRVGGDTAAWARVDALGIWQSDVDALAAAQGRVGLDQRLGSAVVGASGALTRLGPGELGFWEGEARAQLTGGATLQPFLSAALAWRDDDRGQRPSAAAGLRWHLDPRWALRLEGGWQSIEDAHRWVGGAHLEVSR